MCNGLVARLAASIPGRLIILGALLAVSLATLSPSNVVAAGMTLSPASGPPGTKVTASLPAVQNSDFVTHEGGLVWDSQTVVASFAGFGSFGAMQVTFTVPSDATIGQHSVIYTVEGPRASATFTVTSSSQQPPTTNNPTTSCPSCTGVYPSNPSSPGISQPSASVSPSSGPPGTTVLVRGQGWAGNHRIQLNFWKPTGSIEVGTMITTDSSGRFSVNVAIPANATPKPALHLVARDLDGGPTLDPADFFTITGAPPTTNTTNGPTSSCPINVAITCDGNPTTNAGPNPNQGCVLGATAICGPNTTQPNNPDSSSGSGPLRNIRVTGDTQQVCIYWDGAGDAQYVQIYTGDGAPIGRNAATDSPKCLQAGVATCFMVSAVYNSGETGKSTPVCANGGSQPSTNTSGNANQQPPLAADPTGRWIAPADNSAAPIGTSLHFEATADASHGVTGVNFTGILPGGGSNWGTLCQGQPIHDDVYACDWQIDPSKVSQGDLIIGFDVYDGANAVAPSPDHNRIVHLASFGTISVPQPQNPTAPKPTLIIFAPGIDPAQSDAQANPYAVALGTFGPILTALGCPQTAGGNETPVLADYLQLGNSANPVVDCGNNVSWLPLSYTGVGTLYNPNQLKWYSGADTGQNILQSRDGLQQTYALATQQRQFDAVYVVGHSLGGAVASYWAASQSNVRVITLDSPVNGFWNLDQSVLATYCAASAGLHLGTGVSCDLARGQNAVNSTIARQLGTDTTSEDTAITSETRRAVSFNFAYAFDSFVPSWYAINPQSSGRAQLFTTEACPHDGITDPNWTTNLVHHACVINLASAAVGDIILRGAWDTTGKPASAFAAPISVKVCLSQAVWDVPMQVQLQLRGISDRIVASDQISSAGQCKVFSGVPWIDMIVKVTGSAGEARYGILPGQDNQVTITIRQDGASEGGSP